MKRGYDPPMLRRALILMTVLLAASAAAAGSARAASGSPIFTGFYSVLAYGEGEGTSAQDLATNTALDTIPAADTNQLSMYEGLEQAWPGFTSSQMLTYYKDSGFEAEPSSSALDTLSGQLDTTVTGSPPAVESPQQGVTIVRQPPYDVPRIYAATRTEAMWAAGYVTAEDRLFMMDVLRHTAEGTMTSLLGASEVPDDSTELGVQDQTPAQYTAEAEQLPQEAGAEGQQALDDLNEYVAGINAYINVTKLDPEKLPAEYLALGVKPTTWTLADTMAVGTYLIGQELVLADDQAQQSEALLLAQQQLGVKQGTEVYDDLRQNDSAADVVSLQQRFNGQNLGKVNRRSEAMITPGTLKLRDAETGGPEAVGGSGDGGAERQALARLPAWAQALVRTPIDMHTGDSNVVLVDAKRSGDGQAYMVGGPQVNYYTPEIFLEYELHAPGIDVSGIGFPGASPYPVIGHGIDYAWTGTSAFSSNADMFAEKLCNPDGSTPSFASTHYLYKGRCIPFVTGTIIDKTPIAVTSPSLPQTITMHTENSVHGPITEYGMVGSTPVALATANATVGNAARSYIALERLAENRVDSPQSFVQAMRYITGGENWWYVDDRHIALLQSGWYPDRAPGTDPDFPIWGTGHYDWKGFNAATGTYDRLPAKDNPTSIDPRDGYLVNWNNEIAHGWPIAAGYWAQGSVVRASMLLDDLHQVFDTGSVTLAKLTGMVTAPATTSDLRGMGDWPVIRRVIGRSRNATVNQLVALLQGWYAGGSQRRSLTYAGDAQYGPAIRLMDAWWPLLVRAEFQPALGAPLTDFINSNLNAISPDGLTDGTGNAFTAGWENDVQQDLRQVLGEKVAGRFSRTYCGGGELKRCRALLISTLLEADAELVKQYGASESSWVYPTICSTAPTTCDEVSSETVGAVELPAQPLDNRGTFYQAVAISGHR